MFEKVGKNGFVKTSANHTFGTDALLLSHFAAAFCGENICDLGTGCGIIPIALSVLVPGVNATGVDISRAAIKQFEQGIEKSNLQATLAPLCGDLKEIEKHLPPAGFKVVVSNPPYHTVGSGKISENTERAVAFHEVACTFADVARAAAYLLKPAGKFILCQRSHRLDDVFSALKQVGLVPRQLQFVHSNHKSAPKLFLLMADKRGSAHFLKVLPPLFLNTPAGEPTQAYNNIYRRIYAG